MTQNIAEQKAALRSRLRKARREHAASLPPEVRALIFHRPPAAIRDLVPEAAVIGLYHADAGEAPVGAYARFFHDEGHLIALPRVTRLSEPMSFRRYRDPRDESELEAGPMGLIQPSAHAEELVPDVLFMPLVGFTERGERLGQGGGFYDRWLEAHPATIAIGMAWDMQKLDSLPVEAHDIPLRAIVTPTQIYGPF